MYGLGDVVETDRDRLKDSGRDRNRDRDRDRDSDGCTNE